MSENTLKRLKSIFPDASITETEKHIKVHADEFNDKSLTKFYTVKSNMDIVGNSTIRRSGAGVTLKVIK